MVAHVVALAVSSVIPAGAGKSVFVLDYLGLLRPALPFVRVC